MKCSRHIALVLLAGLLATAGAHANAGPGGGGGGAGGGGGGHGGGAGHGGFSGGHSSGHSGGGGFSHAIGHSFGRLFGHHGKTSDSANETTAPVAGAALLRGKVAQLPARRAAFFPVGPGFRHRRRNDFPFGDRFLFFPPGAGFGFGGCWDYGFLGFDSFGNEFNCFDGGLFFDPLFIAGFSGDYLSGQAFLPFNDEELLRDSGYESGPTSITESTADSASAVRMRAEAAGIPKNEKPVTLLQFRDGTMYGLVDYWVEDGQLHYTTTYGGQGVVGFERIDLEKTMQLNADRGTPFVLLPKERSK